MKYVFNVPMEYELYLNFKFQLVLNIYIIFLIENFCVELSLLVNYLIP